jgi:hypothetical protein
MAARRDSRADKGFIWLSGIAAMAGLWMVAVALGGEEGLLLALSSPRTMTEAPRLDPAPVARHHAGTTATLVTTPRASDVGWLVSAPLPTWTATPSTPANQFIAASDPRQQLLSSAAAVRRSKPLPRGLWMPGASSPPLRSGDQT